MTNKPPRPIAVGDAGHLLGDDEPVVVIAVFDTGRLHVIGETGHTFRTWVTCLVRETDSLDPARLLLAIRYSQLLAFL